MGGLPTAAETERARGIVSKLSLQQVSGQLIVSSWSGVSAANKPVEALHLGGLVAFPASSMTAGKIAAINRNLTKAASKRGYPLFLAIDQEGGTVARLHRGVLGMPPFMAVGAADQVDLTQAAAWQNADGLRRLGFTVQFAPVADVTVGGADRIIGSRSAGARPASVAAHVLAATRGVEEAGLVAVIKHFPGHGSINADSHRSLAVQTAPWSTLLKRDLVPFREAVDAGVPGVMSGHIIVRSLHTTEPATTSRRALAGVLREKWGYQGLIVTDALNMQGVQRRHRGARVAVAAVIAGADVLLMPPNPLAARAALVRAVRAGELTRARLDASATRMIAALLHAAPQPPSVPTRFASTRLARAAVTSVAGPCSGRLIGHQVVVKGAAAKARLIPLLRQRGVRVVRTGAPVIALGAYGWPRNVDVAVAVDRPGPLSQVKARVKIASFGSTNAAMNALVEVLLGERSAPGRLPVSVPGLPRQGC